MIEPVLLRALWLVVNSCIVFFAVTGTIQLALALFRIENPRLRVILRIVPVLKLPLDLILYALPIKHHLMNLNPFSCAYALQRWLASQFNLELQAPSLALQIALVAVLLISVVAVTRTLVQQFLAVRQVREMLYQATPSTRTVTNALLARRLALSKTRVMESTDVEVPCAMRRRVIVIPTYLIPQLTDQEFDAVVAHELEHLRFHDPLFKQLGSLICSLFWWIPTNWWLNRIHQEQERACDASIANYGLHPHALATALCNVIRESKQGPDLVTLCQFTSRKSDTMARLRAMLDRPATRGFRRGRFALASLVTGAMISSIWIC